MALCPNDKLYQEEIVKLESVIHAYRQMMISLGVNPVILDNIEEEAYLSV